MKPRLHVHASSTCAHGPAQSEGGVAAPARWRVFTRRQTEERGTLAAALQPDCGPADRKQLVEQRRLWAGHPGLGPPR